MASMTKSELTEMLMIRTHPAVLEWEIRSREHAIRFRSIADGKSFWMDLTYAASLGRVVLNVLHHFLGTGTIPKEHLKGCVNPYELRKTNTS